MIAPKVLLFAKTLSATALGARLTSAEAINGPLTAIGHSATKTAGTFGFGHVPPGALTVIVVDGPAAPAPGGAVIVCRGSAWISSAEQWVIVTRQP